MQHPSHSAKRGVGYFRSEAAPGTDNCNRSAPISPMRRRAHIEVLVVLTWRRSMSASIHSIHPELESFEVRFESLSDAGGALVFPCDACGRVDLDALAPRARSNYFFARTLVGRNYGSPHVLRTGSA
jgi:hypothetical protein